MKVIVAGGGLAGLTATRVLAKARIDVTIVEARGRLGGRVETVALPADQHGELGGEFIDKEQDAIRSLCGELGLRLVRVLRGGFTHRFRDDDGQYHVSRTRPWSELEALVAPHLQPFKEANGSADSEIAREIAAWSLRAWLRERQATPGQHSMVDALRGFFLADPDDLSLLPLVQQLATDGSPAQVEMYRIEGGTGRLVEALAREAAARVLLRHRLEAITHSPERVFVSVADSHGHRQQLEADAAIVTLPASTLRDVAIAPPLPDTQWRAIGALRYGAATKVVLQSPQGLFRGRARAFATDTALGAFWDSTEGQLPGSELRLPGGSVLTFLGGGSTSATLKARAERRAEELISDLCWLGMARAPVTAMHTRTWEDEPFARGGYAYLDPSFDPAWRPLLGQRVGRLFFAGEHTSEQWQGYMNGAVETGLRAAEVVLRSEL
jgi:monoamine oxidase